MPRQFVHLERVRFGDLDAMRHLNNVVYLRYFETARIAAMRELIPAHDPAHPEAGDFGMIFAECSIRYRSPVQFDEEVAIACSVGEARRSAFEMRFSMTVGDRLAAEGEGGWSATTTARARPAPCPSRCARRWSKPPPDRPTPSGPRAVLSRLRWRASASSPAGATARPQRRHPRHRAQGHRAHGHEFIGFRYGWAGVSPGEARAARPGPRAGILPRGGTILGTSRTNPFKDDATRRRGVARAWPRPASTG